MMAEEPDKAFGGMDEAETAAPPPSLEAEQQTPRQDDRPRDDAGRFAGRGQPNEEYARRREAQERDDARRERDQAKADHAALQKRLDDMSSLMRGDDPDKEKAADSLKPLLEKVEGIDKRLTERDEAQQAERIDAQVRTYADQDEVRFRQQQPDFPDAVQHYINSRVREMQALGLSEDQAGQQLAGEAQSLLYQAAQAGASPAQMIYAMAQARGYAPQGQRPANIIDMPARTAQPNAGGRSFGNGGGPAGGGMTAAQIASMDEADYMAFRATPEGRRAIQRAMGG